MSVEFEDYSIKVKEALNEGTIAGLHLAAAEIQTQAARNSRIDEGHLKGSWDYSINEGDCEATIGSPLENAIWEEYGTGEYAAKGNGRKGGWLYENRHGETVFTKGKKPNRTLQRAFDMKRNTAVELLKRSIQEAMK